MITRLGPSVGPTLNFLPWTLQSRTTCWRNRLEADRRDRAATASDSPCRRRTAAETRGSSPRRRTRALHRTPERIPPPLLFLLVLRCGTVGPGHGSRWGRKYLPPPAGGGTSRDPGHAPGRSKTRAARSAPQAARPVARQSPLGAGYGWGGRRGRPRRMIMRRWKRIAARRMSSPSPTCLVLARPGPGGGAGRRGAAESLGVSPVQMCRGRPRSQRSGQTGPAISFFEGEG